LRNGGWWETSIVCGVEFCALARVPSSHAHWVSLTFLSHLPPCAEGQRQPHHIPQREREREREREGEREGESWRKAARPVCMAPSSLDHGGRRLVPSVWRLPHRGRSRLVQQGERWWRHDRAMAGLCCVFLRVGGIVLQAKVWRDEGLGVDHDEAGVLGGKGMVVNPEGGVVVVQLRLELGHSGAGTINVVVACT
jgi:hypothetical protein